MGASDFQSEDSRNEAHLNEEESHARESLSAYDIAAINAVSEADIQKKWSQRFLKILLVQIR